MASVKKHLQNLHSEVCEKIQDEKGLEEHWRIVKTNIQSNLDINPKKDSSQRKKASYSMNIKNEQKEDVKDLPHSFIKEEPIKSPEKIGVNPMVGTYYNQVQSEMFPMPYGSPFIYSQPNYEFLCMLQAQAAKQNATMRPNNFWMPNIPESIQKTAPSFDPMIPRQMNYPSQPNKILPVEPTPSQMSTNPISGLLARASVLPTILTTPIPQSEHRHIHCEFCGHCTIRHNGHIDYVHDAELHHVDALGFCFDHE